MHIKTITCHEVYNYGASLQEYALLEFLKQNGHDAQTIHYKPPHLSNHFNLNRVSNPKFDKPIIKQFYLLAKLPSRLKSLKRKKVFDDFHQKYIPTHHTLYKNNEELKNNPPQADAFICGSDQIWNSFFQNGKDSAFYLNFVPDDKKKISYAASFAIDELEESIKPFVKENVLRLNAVSVRETSAVGILNELGIDNVVQVLDPVFLLDKEHWISRFITPITEKYIFVYDFDTNPVVKEIALKLKKEKGFLIYTVNRNIDYADKNFHFEGPEKFLSLVYHSQFNLTNSFHAVAFSLIFEKQFAVINRTEKINTRMKDLLALMNLKTHLFSNKEEFGKLKTINFAEVGKHQSEYTLRSEKFLLSTLEK